MSLISQVRQARIQPWSVPVRRLSLVAPVRSQAPRAPFAILVALLLAGGVVGLLMFNTQMQQTSFHATALEKRADELVAKKQSLDMQLERLRDPQHLAARGRALGMVPPSVPSFIRLSDEKVIGVPTTATPDDAIVIDPRAPRRPAKLRPDPIIVRVAADPAAQGGDR